MILDKLDRLSQREKIGLLCAIVFLFGFLIDQFAVRSIVRKLKQMDVRIAEARDTLNNYRKQLARENELKVEYDTISSMVVKSASPSEAVAGMKAEIYDAAKQTSVTVNSMEQRETKSEDFCDTYSVEVTKFDAEMRSLISFLYKIGSSAGMMKVTRVNISPDTRPGKTRTSVTGSILLTKVMLVDARSRPPAKKAAAPAAGAAGATAPAPKK
jgi:hypothetical protein